MSGSLNYCTPGGNRVLVILGRKKINQVSVRTLIRLKNVAPPPPELTRLFLGDARGSVIHAPNRVPDVFIVTGPVIFINFPHAVKKKP